MWQVIAVSGGLRLFDWFVIIGIIIIFILYRMRQKKGSNLIINEKVPVPDDSKTVSILEEAGYSLLEVEPTVMVDMVIQGKSHQFEIKSDYLVLRNGRRYLVHLRHDGKQVRLHAKVWRNSFLSDVLVFNADGVLVVDVLKGSINEVLFRI